MLDRNHNFTVLLLAYFVTLLASELFWTLGEVLYLGDMRKFNPLILMMAMLCVPLAGVAQQEDAGVTPMLSAEQEKEAPRTKVTAVYGVTADDYLPSLETARQYLRPKVRRAASHPAFDLPEPFYYIGGPIFILILLRVIVIFLNGFEEKQKEEQREAASQSPNPE